VADPQLADPFADLGAEPIAPPPPPGAAPANPDTPDRPKMSRLEGAGRGAMHGFLFGLDDEWQGVSGKLAGMLRGGDIPRAAHRGVLGTRAEEEAAPLSERTDYDVERDAARDVQAQAKADTAYEKTGWNPVLAYLTPDSAFGAGEAGASMITSAIPITRAAPTAGLLGRFATNAINGGVHGLVRGFGDAEGTAAEQAKQTIAGGAKGAASSVVAGEGLHQLGRGARAAGGKLGQLWDDLTGGAQAREVELGSPKLARAAEAMTERSPQGAQLRAAAVAGKNPEVIESRARSVGQKIDDLYKRSDIVRWDEDIASKGRAITKMLERQPPGTAAVEAADGAVAKARQAWDELAQDVGKGEGAATISRLKREAWDAYDQRVGRANVMIANDPAKYAEYHAERFMALDDLKRKLQKTIASKRFPHDDVLHERMEEPLRQTLENPELWGTNAAALQRVRNAGWTRRLTAKGRPEHDFTLERGFGERSADPYAVLDTHDIAKVHGIIRNAGTIEGEQAGKNLVEWADREAGLLEALTKYEGADPALVAHAQSARKLATEIADELGERHAEASAARLLDQLQAAPPPKPSLGRRIAEVTPGLSKLAENTRPTPIGQRAARIAELEELVRMSPGNKRAQLELDGLQPGASGHVVTGLRMNATRAAAHGGAALGGGAAPSGDAVRESDRALDDPQWGQLLRSKPAGEARDSTYAMLLQTEPEFRARVQARALAQKE
jgi:hypothetical protein